eukprot:7162259-Alexandrium_andersonii.AAC.1
MAAPLCRGHPVPPDPCMLDREAPRRPYEAERFRAARGGVSCVDLLSLPPTSAGPTSRCPEKFP